MLIHGGTFDDRCWDRLAPLLGGPVTRVRLPGRGGVREDELGTLTQQDYRDAVAQAVAAIGDDMVLVAHSLAGLSVGAGACAAPDRVRHVALLSAAIPAPGQSVLSMREAAEADSDTAVTATRAGAVVEPDRDHIAYMAPDLSAADVDYAYSIAVRESSGPVLTAVAPGTDDIPAPKTWVRLTADPIFTPTLQTSTAERIGVERIVDLDSGHLPMISCPPELAAILAAL